MRILLTEKIAIEDEDKILVVREFDPAEDFAVEEYAARNDSSAIAVDISLDDPRFDEQIETNPSGDAFAVYQTVAILD
jgi:hypothetical protein